MQSAKPATPLLSVFVSAIHDDNPADDGMRLICFTLPDGRRITPCVCGSRHHVLKKNRLLPYRADTTERFLYLRRVKDMTKRSAGSVLQYLHRVVGPPTGSAASDAQLLHRFAGCRDEAAFAELVRRHGRLVWNVCRRMLGHDQDAEDAFQATFIILADKAASIRKRRSVASWLYGVAMRTAWNARKSIQRRRDRERHAEERSSESPVNAASLRELQNMLDEEVRRLPEKYQTPFVLCCLEGKGRAEAARELGWKEGTVSSRLALARERLQKRLARRGVALSAALCVVSLSRPKVMAAPFVAANASERAVILAKGVLRNMAVTKWKIGAAVVLMLGCLTAGGATAVRQVGTKKQLRTPSETASKPAEPRQDAADLHGDPLPEGAVARLGTLRFRAGGGITALAFSPDGKIIASCSNGNAIRLWEAASGKQIRALMEDGLGNVNALAFSPDGKTLTTGSIFFDVQSGKKLDRLIPPFLNGRGGLLEPVGGGTSVVFSPDGKLLATGHADKTVRLWDVASRKQLRKFDVCRNNWVRCIAFSPDGKTLATGGRFEDHALRLWDVATGAERFGVRGNHQRDSGGVEALAFAPDGKTLATVGAFDKDVRLWDAATGRELRQFHGHTVPPGSLAFSPDGKQFVSGGGLGVGYGKRDPAARIWDVASGRELHQLAGHQDIVTCVVFSPDGKTIATGGWDSSIVLWNAQTGKPLDSRPASQGTVDSIAFAPDGERVATRTAGAIHVWEAATGKELHRLSVGKGGMALTPDGKLLASAEADGGIRLWDAHTGREQRRLRGHRGEVNCVAFSPDGKYLVSGGLDRTTRLWDVASGKELRQMIGRTLGLPPRPIPGNMMPPMPSIPGNNEFVICLAFAPDGKTIASGYSDNTVRVWETATGKQVHQLAEQGMVAALAFSPDGRTLASGGGWDHKIRLWETASGKVRLEIAGHGDRVLALAFSPDGQTLASSAWEPVQETYLWDVRTGKLSGRLGGHRGPILSLARSRDGNRLATGSSDTTVLLWDMSDRTPPRRRKTLSLSPHEMEELWRELSQRYARAPEPTFSRAVWRLSTVPEQTVPFLAQRLRPKVLDMKKVPRWVADLDSEDRAVAGQALDKLIEVGDAAKPALREALKGKRAPQGRKLIEGLLAGIQSPLSEDESRELEAIEVLRRIDNEESRALLKKLAGGAPGVPLTRAAAAALKGVPRKQVGVR